MTIRNIAHANMLELGLRSAINLAFQVVVVVVVVVVVFVD